jgi:hypothetical protein
VKEAEEERGGKKEGKTDCLSILGLFFPGATRHRLHEIELAL